MWHLPGCESAYDLCELARFWIFEALLASALGEVTWGIATYIGKQDDSLRMIFFFFTLKNSLKAACYRAVSFTPTAYLRVVTGVL